LTLQIKQKEINTKLRLQILSLNFKILNSTKHVQQIKFRLNATFYISSVLACLA